MNRQDGNDEQFVHDRAQRVKRVAKNIKIGLRNAIRYGKVARWILQSTNSNSLFIVVEGVNNWW